MKVKRKFRNRKFKAEWVFAYTADGFKVNGVKVEEQQFKDLLFHRTGFKSKEES